MPKANRPRHDASGDGAEQWLAENGVKLADIKEVGHFEDGSMTILFDGYVTVIEFAPDLTTALAAHFRANGLPIRRTP